MAMLQKVGKHGSDVTTKPQADVASTVAHKGGMTQAAIAREAQNIKSFLNANEVQRIALRVYNSQRRKALNAKQVSQMLQKLISKAERAKDQEDFTSGKMPIQESIFDRTSTHIAPIRERFNILNEHMMKNLNK